MRKAFILFLGAMLLCGPVLAYDYYYYLGPWVWHEGDSKDPMSYWGPPEGTVGSIDLRSVSDQDSPGEAFFATTTPLPSEYSLLYFGDIMSPLGKATLDLLWNKLTVQSDPSGQTSVKPLMPTSKGKLELWLGGHSLVKSEQFSYGVHSHTTKVKELLQNDYRKIRSNSIAKSNKHYLKVLDFWGDKYGVKNPENEFIPNDLPKESPLIHETIVTDDFNRGNSSSMGNDSQGNPWGEVVGDWSILSNQLTWSTLAADISLRNGTALSSDDHYSQADQIIGDGGNFQGCASRFNSGNHEKYGGMFFENSDIQRMWSINAAGAFTQIASQTLSLAEGTYVGKMESDGSSQTYTLNGTDLNVTNSTITGNTQTGLIAWGDPVEKYDNFEAADLVALGRTRRMFAVT